MGSLDEIPRVFVHRANCLEDLYKHYHGKDKHRAFEIDVQWADGQVVVFHDDINDGACPDGGIPTLAEFLRFSPRDIVINVELKVYSPTFLESFVETVLRECNSYKKNGYMFSSFHPPALALLQRLDKEKRATWGLAHDWQQYCEVSDKHACICVNALIYPKIHWELHNVVGVYNCTPDSCRTMHADFFIVDP